MSTQNKTQSTNQYDSGSMGTFGGLNKSFGSAVQGEIDNPYGNPFFNLQQARGNQAVNAQNSSGQQAMMQRAQALGINPNSPQFAAMMNQSSRWNMGLQSDMQSNLMLQAANMRQGAIGMAGQYKPLQTGHTDVQTQSGLGTWLPQLAGAAIGGLTGMAGMGAFGGKGGGGGGSSSNFSTPGGFY